MQIPSWATAVGKWFLDAATMPKRIRALAEMGAAEADTRIRCLECVDGRLVNFQNGEAGGFVEVVAQCPICQQWFAINPRAREIIGIADGPAHLPSSADARR